MATSGKGDTDEPHPRSYVREMLRGIRSPAYLPGTQQIRTSDPMISTRQELHQQRGRMSRVRLLAILTEACRLIDEDYDCDGD
jgi:hypothetical protein